jgi:protein ImuB
MPQRRILSLWFPRLAAERVLRAEPQLAEQPLAVVAEVRGALMLASLDAAAERRGSAAAWRSATPARSVRGW